MNWNEEYDVSMEEKNNTLRVTLKVVHIKGKRNFLEKTYTTTFIKEYLSFKNVLFGDVEQETTVFNYQSEKRTEGTWVFSLPPKPKPKKTQPPVEKKENVLKMTNKKTIKK
jgi:hypothetical protein